MTLRQVRLGRAGALALLFGCSVVLGCRVSRQVHEPREYPAIKIQSPEIYAVIVDARASASDPTQRQLSLPRDFEPRVQKRLANLASGSGAALGVVLTVAAADEIEIVDARGEMTRVRVRFDIEFKLKNGSVVRRAVTESTSDLPREDATADEVAFVLDATAIDAFDRYFADSAVIESLNRELAERH